MEEIKKKEKSGSSSCSQDQDPARRDDIISLKPVNGGMKLGNEDDSSKPSTWKKNNELKLAKVEMGEVMLENKRLKSDIDRIMKDYQALQTRFHEMARQESKSHLEDVGNACIDNNQPTTRQLEDGAHELSLSLGRNSVVDSKYNNRPDFRPQETLKESSGLSLSLNYNKNEGGSKTSTEQVAPMQNSSTDNSLDEPKDEAGEAWPPSKVLKTMKSDGGVGGRDDEVVQQPLVKKARVSVRARCDTPTMNDGCQWRKYGQKIAKGNPCPRAYYRCTVAPSCPVRKQVQRCADDMSILITTYEGTHNHSLPISATAMASTTSAAAFMLISGSSTNSGLRSTGSTPITTNTSTNFASNSVSNLPGLNFNFSDTSRSSPLFLPNSSFLPSPSQPTITLDLTTSSTSSTSTSQFSKLVPTNFAPRPYPTTSNLTFNSLDMSNLNSTSNTLPISWPPNGLLNYNTTNPTTHTRTQVGPKPTTNGAMSCDQETFYQTLLQMINPNPNYNILTSNSSNKQPPQSSLDTVAVAAKVITSDPSFQSVLTAALSTLIGENNNTNGTRNVGVSAGPPNVAYNCHTSDFNHKVKSGNQKSSTSTLANDGVKASNGCTSSFLSIEPNNTPISPAANLMVISSHLPFSDPSKSTSTSPGASRE